MTHQFKIEDIPHPKGIAQQHLDLPFSELNVGQSFLVPFTAHSNSSVKKAVHAFVKAQGSGHVSDRICLRTMREEAGTRVYRVA